MTARGIDDGSKALGSDVAARSKCEYRELGDRDGSHVCDASAPHLLKVDADSVLDTIGYWILFDEAEEHIGRREAELPLPVGPLTSADSPENPRWLQARRRRQQIAASRRALDELEMADTAAYAISLRQQLRTTAAAMFPAMPIEVEVDVRRAGHRADGQTQRCGRLAMVLEVARRSTALPSSGRPLSEYRGIAGDVGFADVERAAGLAPLDRIRTGAKTESQG